MCVLHIRNGVGGTGGDGGYSFHLHSLLPVPQAKLIDVARRKCNKLHQDYNARIKSLSDRPQVLKSFATFVEVLCRSATDPHGRQTPLASAFAGGV